MIQIKNNTTTTLAIMLTSVPTEIQRSEMRSRPDGTKIGRAPVKRAAPSTLRLAPRGISEALPDDAARDPDVVAKLRAGKISIIEGVKPVASAPTPDPAFDSVHGDDDVHTMPIPDPSE